MLALVSVISPLVVFAGYGTAIAAQRNIQVVFRYDDYSNITDTAVEQAILDVFASVHGRHVFAVIPLREGWINGAKADLLRRYYQNSSLEIALHGYEHKKVAGYSEFLSAGHGEQLRMLREGKSRLESATGALVITFVPPWNVYDANTLRALKDAGIGVLSASLRSGRGAGGIAFAPCTCEIRQVRTALEQARKCIEESSRVIIVGYHAYDFAESKNARGKDFSVNDFITLVRGLAREPDVQLVAISDLWSSHQDLSPERFTANMLYDCRARNGPPLGAQKSLLYHSLEYLSADGGLTTARLFFWGWYIVSAVVPALIGVPASRILRRWPTFRKACMILFASVPVTAAAYGLCDERMFSYWEGLTGLCVASGALAGFLVGMFTVSGRDGKT